MPLPTGASHPFVTISGCGKNGDESVSAKIESMEIERGAGHFDDYEYQRHRSYNTKYKISFFLSYHDYSDAMLPNNCEKQVSIEGVDAPLRILHLEQSPNWNRTGLVIDMELVEDLSAVAADDLFTRWDDIIHEQPIEDLELGEYYEPEPEAPESVLPNRFLFYNEYDPSDNGIFVLSNMVDEHEDGRIFVVFFTKDLESLRSLKNKPSARWMDTNILYRNHAVKTMPTLVDTEYSATIELHPVNMATKPKEEEKSRPIRLINRMHKK